jgi:hypothetical protein
MSTTLVNNATFQFTPDPSWNWFSWSGQLSVPALPHTMMSEGKPVILPSDIRMAAMLLIGKPYISVVFSDVPGVVVSANIIINEATLSMKCTCQGERVATQSTGGTFIANVVPSMKIAMSPIPDPVVVKSGTWSIVMPGQFKTTTS